MPVVSDARDYLEAKRTYGLVGDAAAKLFKSASDFLTIMESNEMVEDLVQTTGWSVELDTLWNQAAYGLRNRGVRFHNMAQRHEFPALLRVVTDWAEFFDETPAPLPDSPFYPNTTVYVSKRTLGDLIERGGQIAADADGLKSTLSSIKEESHFQLSQLTGAFFENVPGRRSARC